MNDEESEIPVPPPPEPEMTVEETLDQHKEYLDFMKRIRDDKIKPWEKPTQDAGETK